MGAKQHEVTLQGVKGQIQVRQYRGKCKGLGRWRGMLEFSLVFTHTKLCVYPKTRKSLFWDQYELGADTSYTCVCEW